MNLNLESLIIVLAFILPGFLTSRLISSRTPIVNREISSFEETFNSLLRSLYINLIIGGGVLFFLYLLTLLGQIDLQKIISSNVSDFVVLRPFLAPSLIIFWLLLALILAAFFGAKWDPLDYLSNHLSESVGTSYNDPWYELQAHATKKRLEDGVPAQMWVQARLNNGFVYQGEFDFISFRHDNKSREILLKNARLYQPLSQEDEPEEYDAVVLTTENCESFEILFTSASPTANVFQSEQRLDDF